MPQLAITLHCPKTGGACGLCGGPACSTPGPRLSVAESMNLVCPDCARKHAPSLVALLDLARVAERVGRIGQHTLVPPLGALLDLARAAENYTQAAGGPGKQAA
jgi:hypothetical protein